MNNKMTLMMKENFLLIYNEVLFIIFKKKLIRIYDIYMKNK